MTASATPPPDGPDLARTSGRAAGLVGLGILFSRISGLLREVVLSSYLGTRAGADAFGAALRIPKMLQNLLGEGALSASFIPEYSKLLDEDKEEANRLAGAVFGLMVAVLAGLVLAAMALAGPLTSLIAPGFSGEKYDLTVKLLRIMTPGIGFIVLAAWCLGVLNAHRKFFLSYVTPVVWNAAIIVGLLVTGLRDQVDADIATAAAWGVLIGGILQFVIQVPAVISTAGGIRANLAIARPSVRRVLSRFGPAVMGRGVVTVSSFLDVFLASLLATGALAVLDRAQVLYLMPISVFAASVAAADLPELSREVNALDRTIERLSIAADRVAFFLVFSAIAFVTMGKLIISAVYERGAFGADSTIVVWFVLAAFSFGIVPSGLSRLLQNASFALGDVSGPARIAAIRMATSIIVGLLLMFTLDRYAVFDEVLYRDPRFGGIPAFSPLPAEIRDGADLIRLGAMGLGIGAAVGAWLELAMLRRRLAPTLGLISFKPTLRRLAPAAFTAAALGMLATWSLDGLPAIVGAILGLGFAGTCYVLLANRGGNSAAKAVLGPIRRRVWS